MKVILKETIDSLGLIGSQVDVANGYARNYLFPQGKAVLATQKTINIFKQKKVKLELQIAKEKKIAQQIANKLNEIKCTISSKTYEEDKLYGSVGIREIINSLEKQNVKIEKKMILLKEPIKSVGNFKIPVKIYDGIEAKIMIEVIPE